MKRYMKLTRYQREMLFDAACGFVCGVIITVVGCLLLRWFRNSGAELLFRLSGAVGY